MNAAEFVDQVRAVGREEEVRFDVGGVPATLSHVVLTTTDAGVRQVTVALELEEFGHEPAADVEPAAQADERPGMLPGRPADPPEA